MFRHVLAILAIATGACALEEHTSVTEQGICGSWLCGGNSPVMDSYGMYDLSLSGAKNADGLYLKGFYKGGNKFTPKVYGGKLTATRIYYVAPFWVIQTLTGTDLVGGYFWIGTSDGTGKSFAITVKGVESVQSWAQPNPAPPAPVMLESYVLKYTFVTGGPVTGVFPPTNICTHPPDPILGATYVPNPETLGQYEASTLLFEGDRIDPVTKRDYATDNTWFNFGCAGHALAKLALTGHTQAAANAGTFDTTLVERTTMLNMLTANYCGDGNSFTVSGQPLRWRDNRNTMFYNQPILPIVNTTTPNVSAVLEARWNENGPVCLHRPRVDVNPTTESHQTDFYLPHDPWVPIYQQIQQYCPQSMPPECADQSFAVDGFHLVSITPTPAAQPAP